MLKAIFFGFLCLFNKNYKVETILILDNSDGGKIFTLIKDLKGKINSLMRVKGTKIFLSKNFVSILLGWLPIIMYLTKTYRETNHSSVPFFMCVFFFRYFWTDYFNTKF